MLVFVNFDHFMLIVCWGTFCKRKFVFVVRSLRVLKRVITNYARLLLVLLKVFIVFKADLLLKIYIKYFDYFVHVDLLTIILVVIFYFSSFESLTIKFDVDIFYHFFIHQFMYHATLKIKVRKKHLGLIQMLKLMD